jgi:hypothetical protein
MPGTGAPPMLKNGYAMIVLCFWFPNAKQLDSAFWNEFCPMFGNALPNNPPAPMSLNPISTDSISLADWNCVCSPVIELFWIKTGNPHDIGTRLAFTGYDNAVMASRTSISNVNLFTILTTLLLIKDIIDVN